MTVKCIKLRPPQVNLRTSQNTPEIALDYLMVCRFEVEENDSETLTFG